MAIVIVLGAWALASLFLGLVLGKLFGLYGWEKFPSEILEVPPLTQVGSTVAKPLGDRLASRYLGGSLLVFHSLARTRQSNALATNTLTRNKVDSSLWPLDCRPPGRNSATARRGQRALPGSPVPPAAHCLAPVPGSRDRRH